MMQLKSPMWLVCGFCSVAAADGGEHRRVAVEVLLDLGEVIHGADRALRREQELRVVAAHGRRVDAQARVVGRESGASSMAPLVWPLTWQEKQVTPCDGSAVTRWCVTLNQVVWNGRDQQAQAVELLGA